MACNLTLFKYLRQSIYLHALQNRAILQEKLLRLAFHNKVNCRAETDSFKYFFSVDTRISNILNQQFLSSNQKYQLLV